MTLNKQKGNMYGFVTHTWNPIRGTCPHACSYCYMKKCWTGPLGLHEPALNDNLGTDRVIFVGSSTDMWAESVPGEWIERVLAHCRKHENQYMFQSKNPGRMRYFELPEYSIVGTTIESNIDYETTAPRIRTRVNGILDMKSRAKQLFVTIEPIMDFRSDKLIDILAEIYPDQINIGADSKQSNLMEPPGSKVEALINELRQWTVVYPKPNLKRLINHD